jgi:hypothetical protein
VHAGLVSAEGAERIEIGEDTLAIEGVMNVRHVR